MKFGDNLKKLRKNKNMSQEDLADKMKVSRQSVSKWETGEAYPEISNLLQLCKMFHCNINDLVNDNIIDISKFDDEVKTNVIKLKKEQQIKIKTLSKIISVICRIGKTVTLIFIPILLSLMILLGFIINKVEVIDNKIVYQNHNFIVDIVEDKEEVFISIFKAKLISVADENEIIKIKELISNNSKIANIGYIETALLFTTICLFFVYFMLSALEQLFNNIYNDETPFTLENVGFIKKISYMMIALMIFPNIVYVIFENLLKIDLAGNFSIFSIVQILFLFSIAIIFQYGYEIQLDSKGKMYEDK